MSEPKPRYRVKAGSARMSAAAREPFQYYGHDDYEPQMLAGFLPTVREPADQTERSLEKQVGRILSLLHSSGFIAGIVQTSISMVVGQGLRMSSRPNHKLLGWTDEQATKFSEDFETRFETWGSNPYACDASGQHTFGGMQQAYMYCAMGYGEGLALIEAERRPGVKNSTKVKTLPPSRIVDKSDELNWVQGVRVAKHGLPISYMLKDVKLDGTEGEVERRVRDKDGRQLVVHRMMPSVCVTRGLPRLGTGMKANRQFDQYGDANLVQKMVRSIFGAIIKSNVDGMAAFQGLMTQAENAANSTQPNGGIDFKAFMEQKGKFYKGSNLDLTNHGRIGRLFPGDELDFVESKAANDEFDPIARWLMLEVAAAADLSYESATGDYRGATYSSVRMSGAKEWLKVLQKRSELIVPFCQAAAEAFLEEEIYTGRIEIPGGYKSFLENREHIARCKWTGPAQPQADEFKSARALQVLVDTGVVSMQTACDILGLDYDDELEAQGRENKKALAKGVPPPHGRGDGTALSDEGVPEGLKAPADSEKGDRKKPAKQTKNRRGGGKSVPDTEPRDALNAALETELAGAD